jgi:hypothetical protein
VCPIKRTAIAWANYPSSTTSNFIRAGLLAHCHRTNLFLDRKYGRAEQKVQFSHFAEGTFVNFVEFVDQQNARPLAFECAHQRICPEEIASLQ